MIKIQQSDFIYFDHNATTPVDDRVLEIMLPYFNKKFANAASITYSMGLDARAMVEQARFKVAHLLNCIDQEIVFTSGSTEGLNTAIKGVFWRYPVKGKHFVSLPTEHQAVIDVLKWIEKQGAEITTDTIAFEVEAISADSLILRDGEMTISYKKQN